MFICIAFFTYYAESVFMLKIGNGIYYKGCQIYEVLYIKRVAKA